MMMAVAVVSIPGRPGFRRKRALLFFGGLEHKAQNARTDHE
jgi:hypothetical protein